jgi:uncharacterized protein (TIGR00369 family)
VTSAPTPASEGGIPAGFKPLTGGPDDMFIGINGPLYRKRDGEQFVLGLRVERRHCNPAGICHGGMLLTFVDMAMVLSASYQGKLGYFLPTINLSADFLAPASAGTWMEARTELLRVTRNMVFAQCMVRADGTPVVRASGVFKIGPELKRPDQD